MFSGLGYNITLHEIGRQWPYPVLSLLFSSGLSVITFGLAWIILQRQRRKPPTRVGAYLSTRAAPPSPQPLVTNAWKWEIPANEQTDEATSSTKSNITSVPDFNGSTSTSMEISQYLSLWTKHKHFIVCGCLLAGNGICTVFMSSRVSYQWQLFCFEVICFLYSNYLI